VTRYCADHSLLLSTFWLAALVGGLIVVRCFCREAAGDSVASFLFVKSQFIESSFPSNWEICEDLG